MKSFEKLVLKAAKSSGTKKAEMLHGSLFVTFTQLEMCYQTN